MDAQQILILVLRFVHIFAGVFWAGGVFFMVRFLTPALTDAGPDAGKVMGPMIMKYKLPAVMISLRRHQCTRRIGTILLFVGPLQCRVDAVAYWQRIDHLVPWLD